jgi:hypothetical protein
LTPVPTQTPAPTPTPAPTSIPGWEKFPGAGVELWLPESFEGGDLSKDLDVITSKLKTLGSDFEQIAASIEQNPSMFAFWAFDSDIKSNFLTNVNVVTEKVVSAITVDTYMDATEKSLPESFKIIDRKTVKLDRYQAGRLIVTVAMPNVTAKESIYIIKEDNIMWLITYATSEAEFDTRQPMFEQSANTFTVTD